MCGIAGIYRLDNQDLTLPSRLNSAVEKLAHRGPDFSRLYISPGGNVGLGHTRLSIIDLSADNNQPFETDRTVVVFNGEIYNYAALRDELKNQGVAFRTQGDTEVISRGYEQWGVEIFSKIKGMYAIGLLDKRADCCFLIRDCFGIKPLYFSFDDKEFVFASEIKALREFQKEEQPINSEVLMDLMSFGYHFSCDSLQRNIQQIPPGQLLCIQRKNKAIETSLRNEKRLELKVEKARFKPSALRNRLAESVQLHMLADVPVAVTLSGGLDSSAVTALASQQTKNLVAYTNTFDIDHDYEVMYSKDLCRYLGIKHRVVLSQIHNLEGFLREVIYYLEEPIPNIATLNSFFLAKAVKEDGYKVALVGEGSDELFGGYPWHLLARDETLSQSSQHLFQAYSKRRSLSEKIYPYLTEAGQTALNSRIQSQEEIFSHIVNPSSNCVLDSFLLFDIKYQLQFSQLSRIDRLFMRFGIEARVPYLYDDIYNYAISIPSKLKIKDPSNTTKLSKFFDIRTDKICLAKALKGVLPKSILKREKFGPRGTNNLYKSTPLGSIDSVFLKVCSSKEYQESRNLVAHLIDWRKAETATNPKLKLFLCLLSMAIDPTLTKGVTNNDENYSYTIVD